MTSQLTKNRILSLWEETDRRICSVNTRLLLDIKITVENKNSRKNSTVKDYTFLDQRTPVNRTSLSLLSHVLRCFNLFYYIFLPCPFNSFYKLQLSIVLWMLYRSWNNPLYCIFFFICSSRVPLFCPFSLSSSVCFLLPPFFHLPIYSSFMPSPSSLLPLSSLFKDFVFILFFFSEC